MLKSLLFSSLLAFSSSSPLLIQNKAPFNGFDTFETASYFNDAFGYLSDYELGTAIKNIEDVFITQHSGDVFIYYAFPIYYDLTFSDDVPVLYYSNDYFNFYLNDFADGDEGNLNIIVDNYIGVQENLYFGRLNSSAMATYIDNEPKLTDGVISSITQWVTGFIAILVSGLGAFVAVFYNGTSLTTLGMLALMGLGIGLVTLAIAFVTRLFNR